MRGARRLRFGCDMEIISALQAAVLYTPVISSNPHLPRLQMHLCPIQTLKTHFWFINPPLVSINMLSYLIYPVGIMSWLVYRSALSLRNPAD